MNSTHILARIFGPISLTLGVTVIVRGASLWTVAREVVNDPRATLVIAVLYLFAGLIVLTFHNKWKGVTQIIITLIGWLMLLRAWVMLFAPEFAMRTATNLFDSPVAAPPFIAIVLGIGCWLSYVGYVDKHHE